VSEKRGSFPLDQILKERSQPHGTVHRMRLWVEVVSAGGASPGAEDRDRGFGEEVADRDDSEPTIGERVGTGVPTAGGQIVWSVGRGSGGECGGADRGEER
jgi:hypothetical protein